MKYVSKLERNQTNIRKYQLNNICIFQYHFERYLYFTTVLIQSEGKHIYLLISGFLDFWNSHIDLMSINEQLVAICFVVYLQ